MGNLSLLSATSRVEAPVIYVTIGDYVFGMFNKSVKSIIDSTGITKRVITTYPNFMKSVTVEKVNGVLNTYTIQMIYAIRNGDDPNLLEKVFSSVSNTRKIKITYGDATSSAFLYKDEEAMISDVRSTFNIQNSTITYTLTCVSDALTLNAGSQSYGKRHMKPSDLIKELLLNSSNGLQDVFFGMRDYDLVLSRGLIASDDKAVDIEAKQHISTLDYLKYLVTCMVSSDSDASSVINNERYVLVVSDEVSSEFQGPYFKVVKVSAKSIPNEDIYDLEIGTSSKDKVVSFSLDDNQTYSILYNYSEQLKLPNYIYRIDNNGNMTYEYSPALSNSSSLLKTTESDKTWWTTVTQFPMTCTVTLKGLLRAATLMSYVNLNVYFYGKRHISSGLYIITRQVDMISEDGCKTVLSLTRMKGSAYDN